jgi:hypothetical protein
MLSAVERGSTCIRPDLALREREKSAIEKRFLKSEPLEPHTETHFSPV